MKIEEYQEATKVTAMYPRVKALEYVTLGLIGELAEIEEKIETDNEVFYELGDACWYISQLCNELNFSLEEVFNEIKEFPAGGEMSPFHEICLIANIVKKVCRDESDNISEDKKEKIRGYIIKALDFVVGQLEDPEESFSKVLQSNIDKLSSRKERGAIKGDGDNR